MRSDFPLFQKNRDLVYLDSASTTQKPSIVLQTMTTFYESSYANVHRGLYPIAVCASQAYESARQTVADFIGANKKEIIFTKGTTESVNAIASMLAPILTQGKNEILLTEMEHHANIVPWQQIAKQYGLKMKYIPVTAKFELDYTAAKKLITKKTAIVSFTHISNTLGTTNDVKKLCKLAKSVGAYSVVDGAQSISHIPINVAKLGCDFFVFSGHKLYGPTGVGVLFGREEVLSQLTPYQTGGNMIESVTLDSAKWADIPHRFEAGTTPFVEALGLAAAIEYLQQKKMKSVEKHLSQLTTYALTKLSKITSFSQVGPKKCSGIISFTLKGIHPHDIADMLGEKNICVRGGHHCTMPLHAKFGLSGTTRVSFGLYNATEDVDVFVSELKKVIEAFK